MVYNKSTPYSLSSNGTTENIVKTFITAFKNSEHHNVVDIDVFKFIFSYNSTNYFSTGVSPAEIQTRRTLYTNFIFSIIIVQTTIEHALLD